MFRRSGSRFADRNMRQIKNAERIPVPWERNTLLRWENRMAAVQAQLDAARPDASPKPEWAP
jgi:hypothetical protein